ncbi:MAG: hypothetical protein ABIQ88_18770 [Chitinophagaceae bacterium]
MNIKPFFLQKFTVTVLFTLLLGGCQKLQDYIHHHGDATYDACSIKKITSVYSNRTITFLFAYNQFGDPVSITNDAVGTGNPNYYFIYNNKKKLTQLLRSYTNGLYEQWFKYAYNTNGQVISDTVYTFGQLSGTPPLPTTDNIIFNAYEYDAVGRIKFVRTSLRRNGVYSILEEKTYTYDANGNLDKGGAVVYDNKLNLKRTNTVWMFITKDYSLNNPFTASQYNANNLPVKFTATDLVPFSTENVTVEYLCH